MSGRCLSQMSLSEFCRYFKSHIQRQKCFATLTYFSSRSQEVFRQAMSSSTVRLEVLPLANKQRYEKSLIGQLFTGDGKDSPIKGKSPMVVRSKTNPQPELKPNAKLEARRPDARAKTPEPGAVNVAPPELQPKHGSLERDSPTPSSPTPRTRSQSPLASKSPAVPGLANLTSKKAGKRIKIDLKKGKYTVE